MRSWPRADRRHALAAALHVAIAVAATTLTATMLVASAQPREEVTARIIVDRLVTNVPLGSCSVASFVAAIGKSTNTPTGVEKLPGPCSTAAAESAATEVLHLQGMTVFDALEKLVKLDTRYYWTETDGVIVVRPVAAWADSKHFLHSVVDRLKLDKADIGDALSMVLAPLRPGMSTANDVMNGIGEVTLDVGPISIVEGLDAIVRADGRIRWEVSYCKPEMRLDYATVAIYTYDNRGVAKPLYSTRDAKGRPFNPCAG